MLGYRLPGVMCHKARFHRRPDDAAAWPVVSHLGRGIPVPLFLPQARILTKTTEELDLRYPEVTNEQHAILAEAKKQLEAEKQN